MNEIEYGTEFLDQLKDSVHDLYDENIKLKSRNKLLSAENSYYKNIINELEKYISQEWYCFDNESVEHEVAKNILNKLKELKERDNKIE